MRQLKGRVAVVTGAANGIGRALSQAFAARGCELALVDVDVEGLERTAREVRAVAAKVSTHVVDVASKEQMQALPAEIIREHGHIHILVNNAGVSIVATTMEQSIEDFEWIVGINLWGVIYGCKFFLPHLEGEEEGHIVNVSSLFGIIGVPTQASYSLTKFAVRGFSEALHAELAGTSVGLSVVHPGVIQTNIVQASRIASGKRRSKLQKRFDRYAMSPERAAAKIIRAIETNQQRVRIGKETYLVDWAKRLFPDLTQRALANGYGRRKLRDRVRDEHELQ